MKMDENDPSRWFLPGLTLLSAIKYGAVVSATILVWDMVSTFDIEVSRIWKAKRNLGIILFLLNRYIPPATIILDVYSQLVWGPSTSFCKFYGMSSMIMTIFSMAVIEAILIMRTHALYQNRFLLFALLSTGVATLGTMLACHVVLFQHETSMALSEYRLRGCLLQCYGPLCRPLFTAFWIPFLVLQSLMAMIFTLTVWKSYKSFTTIQGTTTIIQVLMRDGILYYAVIISVCILNILLWRLAPFAALLGVQIMKTLQVSMCSRLLLNLRGIGEESTTRSIALERVMDRRAAARAVEQRFQSNPRTLV